MNGNAAPRGGENKSDAALDISVRVYPVTNQPEKGNLLAFANVTLGGCFAINDLRLMKGPKGPFVAMPSKLITEGKKQGQYHNICCPITSQMRKDLTAAVMAEYTRVTQKESVHDAIQTGHKNAAERTPPATRREKAR